MGRVLGPALLLLVLVGAGCASDDTSAPAPEASSSSTDEATPSPDQPVAAQLVEMVSTSQGGGEVDRRPVELAPEDHLADLVAGLEAGLPDRVRRAVADAERDPEVRHALAEGRRLMGAVVWVGCETPRDITVTGSGADLEVGAVVPGKGTVQCLVPVTTVAVFLG
jgi:hypothetical protein